jgi:uncharacterized membrane protein YbhN (UPF0104 family)
MRSLKVAAVYTVILLIGLIWFKEPVSLKFKQFMNNGLVHLNLGLIFKVVFSFLMCHLVNALSWMILLQERTEYGFKKNLKATCMYSMLINTFPIGTGHMIGVWFFYKYVSCPAKRLLFAWSLDQYIRGMVKVSSLILFLSLVEPFGELGDKMRTALFYFGSLIFLGAFAILLCRHSSVVQKYWGKLMSRLGLKGESVFEKKWLKTFLFATCLRVMCWFFEFLPVVFLCQVLVPNIGLEVMISLFLSVKMATAYSISPGNFGVHEGVVYFVAKAYGIESDIAISLGVLYHLGFWLPTVFPGLFVLFMDYSNSLIVKYKIKSN